MRFHSYAFHTLHGTYSKLKIGRFKFLQLNSQPYFLSISNVDGTYKSAFLGSSSLRLYVLEEIGRMNEEEEESQMEE